MTGGVIFVSSITRYGGGERWMCDAASGLAERGHRILVIARPGSELERRVRSLGLDCRAVEMRGDLDPRAINSLRAFVKRFAPDAVCANLDREVRISALALLLAGGPAGRRRPKLIPRRGSEFPLKNNFHYRLVYTRCVYKVIANSHATKETMLSKTPWFDRDRAVVIHNGIDVDVYDALRRDRDRIRRLFRSANGLPDDSVLITLAGELTERKGHRFIIDAADAVIRAHPNVRFLFAGDGDAREDIKRRVGEQNLQEYIRLLGFRNDIPEVLTASDILVLPSSVEGFGYVLAEAMAAALPVVATRASSIPEVVEDGVTGLLHGPGERGEISAHLLRLLDDPGLSRSMGEAGYRRARACFHVDRMIAELERLFFA